MDESGADADDDKANVQFEKAETPKSPIPTKSTARASIPAKSPTPSPTKKPTKKCDKQVANDKIPAKRAKLVSFRLLTFVW